MKTRSLLSLLLSSLTLTLPAAPPPAPEGYEWQPDPRFTDEFEGDSLDSMKWYDHHPRWRGRPPAKFMPSSVSVKEGQLQIRNGVLDPPQGRFHIAGGAVVSKSVDAHFGYYEVRMKASRISMSSTFWFSNESARYGDLSISQELDVQEAIGAGKRHPDRKHYLKSNTHVWVRQNGKRITRSVPGDARISPPAGEAFHVYGVWWVDANTAHFYHNNDYQFTLRPDTEFHPAPFERPMHLNLVTETYDWETPPTPEELADDRINTTYYDWVRGYRLVKRDEGKANPVIGSDGGGGSAELDRAAETIVAGPYRAEWESLQAHRNPEWFRDAKFGIYTHWGPVSVGAEDGPSGVQWYGKNMYETNNPTFQYHRTRYGPQDEMGYQDMIPKFTAERFDADDWAELFEKSGAKFAGPVAVHHDNFAMWDSKVTRWNSVGMGPRRDITGELGQAIRARGLRLITTFHHGFAWRYFEPAFAYDGADPLVADLYTEFHEPGALPTPRFQDTWLAMVSEVLFEYQPDLIWFDFELEHVITPDYRQRMFALAYNWAKQHGREIGVAHKHRSIHEHTGILDFERGREDRLVPYPWLTDTSVGPWFHQKSVQFKTVDQLVDVLVDIVSKNGCLLLNVGPQADGALPEQARGLLLGIGEWLRIHGEAIYGTRPWTVYGEGPTRQVKAGGFSENADREFRAQDIRFTTQDDTLYALALAWPTDNRLTVRSLASVAGPVSQVTLVGDSEELVWKQTDEGLTVELPAKAPSRHALALRVEGKKLTPAPVPEPDQALRPAADGSLLLEPSTALLHGQRLRVEQRHNHNYLAAWDDPADWASWSLRVPAQTTYEINVVCSTPIRDTEFVVEVGDRSFRGTAPKTSDWYDYRTVAVGRVEIPPGAEVVLKVRAADSANWRAVNIRSIRLDNVN